MPYEPILRRGCDEVGERFLPSALFDVRCIRELSWAYPGYYGFRRVSVLKIRLATVVKRSHLASGFDDRVQAFRPVAYYGVGFVERDAEPRVLAFYLLHACRKGTQRGGGHTGAPARLPGFVRNVKGDNMRVIPAPGGKAGGIAGEVFWRTTVCRPHSPPQIPTP